MSNTYLNHGYLNLSSDGFNEDLNIKEYQTELCFPFVEYETDIKTKIRLVATKLVIDFSGGLTLHVSELIQKDADSWASSGISKIVSTRKIFVDSEGVVVDFEEATEDDTSRELFTVEGTSYDPKVYMKKIKSTYNNEFDFFIKEFFKGDKNTPKIVFSALGKSVGISVPV